MPKKKWTPKKLLSKSERLLRKTNRPGPGRQRYGNDADDEEEFADEYTVTPAILEGLLELERTLNLSEPAAGKLFIKHNKTLRL
jgi:hypothetical protein